MTGSHLKADIGQIRASADEVAAIRSALESSEALVGRFESALGQPSLCQALHSFATDWKIHRDRLCGDLDTFSTWANRAADEYDRTDRDLAKALARTQPGRGSAG